MENSQTVKNKSNGDSKTNVNVNRKYSKYHRKWKPYKYLSYAEKKFLSDKESHMDHLKNVNFILFNFRKLGIIQFYSKI
jgi:hypothetical protein